MDLFFVLSGFLITSILLAARPRDWSEVGIFYARRSLRIFPLYYLALSVCALFLFPVNWPFWVYLVLSMAGVSALLIAVTGFEFRNTGEIWFTAAKYSLLAAFYAGCVGWLICSPEAPVSRALSIRPLRFIGRISYGLYVWHPFAFTLLFRSMPGRSPWLKDALGYPLAFFIACISWYSFERPFLRLKDRFAAEPRLSPQAPISI